MPKGMLAKFSRALFPQRITFKLTLIISLVVGILISALGITLICVTGNVFKAKVKTSHEEIATRAAQEISLVVRRPVELLETAGKLIGRTHGDPWSQETVLVEMSLQFPMFEEILSVDSEGREIASSNPGLSKKDARGDAAFQKAVKGETYLSPVSIGRNYFPEIQIAVPYEELGKVAGVLMATVNLRGLWNITDAIRIGETGRAFVISRDGLLVAHPDKKLVLRNINYAANPATKLLMTGRGSIEYRDPDDHEVYLGSPAPVPGPVPLAVVVRIRVKEAYRLLDQLRLVIGAVLLISLVVSVIVSFMIARRLVHPIQSLRQWSKKVALGDFDYQIVPQSLDEIGRLFIRFKRMSLRLKAAREKERFATLGMMATTISHKLKNSIVFLKTFSQLFPQRKNDAHFIERFERDFASSVDYLERVFRSLSQVASSREIKAEPVDLADVFESIQQAYMEIMAKFKIDFRIDLPALLPEIQGDQEQLQELFVNLIQNSIQAMSRGGRLVISAFHDAGSRLIQVSVSDTGCGISPQNLGQIFKPFFTTKHGGMGIGLAISQKIVQEHGGSMSVASEEGKGTVFAIKLPVDKRTKAMESFSSKDPKLILEPLEH